MKFNFGSLKCAGFCMAFCLALCLAQIFLTGCGPQKTELKNGDDSMPTITKNDTPFACDMSALNGEQRKRVLDLLKELRAKRLEVKELPDGFAFRYTMDSGTLRDAAEFITYERLCCPFFNFALEVEKDNGAMWFKLSGREGIKDFIKLEFDV